MIINKKNEVYLQIECDDGIARELTDFFTFEVPGAKFMPAYKNKVWDGKIRLFSPGTGEIYCGLLPYIKEFCDRNDIEYTLSEGVEDVRDVPKELVKSWIKALKPRSRGKSIDIRDYQLDAVHHAITNHRTLLLSPTASGKSFIIYCLTRYYQTKLEEEGKRVLILVPTTSLVEQMYADFMDYGWLDAYVQRIYQGHTKKVEKEVVISTWQSIYKMPTTWFEQFGCVIGDEAHLFKAKSLSSIMQKLHLCKYRVGLTGTLDGTQTHRLVLEGVFGTVNKVVSTKELMDNKTLADLQIKCIVLKYPESDCKQLRETSYQEEMDFLVAHEKRNKFIVDLTKMLRGNTLVLFQYVEKHGSVLYDLINTEVGDKQKVFFVYGGTDTDTREEIRAITEEEKDAIIIASYGTFSTGINIRNLHNIVFASPSKSRIRNLQSIGRGLRQSEHKDSAKLFDIADDLTYKNKRNFTLNHFIERINIYNEEGFDYEINRVKVK